MSPVMSTYYGLGSSKYGADPGQLSPRVGSKKLEHGPRTTFAGLPSSLAFGVGGQSYSNFLASTLPPTPCTDLLGLWARSRELFCRIHCLKPCRSAGRPMGKQNPSDSLLLSGATRRFRIVETSTKLLKAAIPTVPSNQSQSPGRTQRVLILL